MKAPAIVKYAPSKPIYSFVRMADRGRGRRGFRLCRWPFRRGNRSRSGSAGGPSLP